MLNTCHNLLQWALLIMPQVRMPRGRSRSDQTLPVPSEDENVTQNANTSPADDSNHGGAAEAAADSGSQPSGCTHYVRRCALVVSNFK